MIPVLLAALMAQDLPHVVIETDTGVIEAEIEVKRAPVTAANFLKYVDAKLYDGGRFHRSVKPDNQPDKVVKTDVSQAGRREKSRGVPPIPPARTSVTGLAHEDGVLPI